MICIFENPTKDKLSSNSTTKVKVGQVSKLKTAEIIKSLVLKEKNLISIA
jgi:hypothetical protein